MVSVYILMHVAMKSGNMPGMKSAFIDRAKTALVVIDLQKGVVGRQTAPHAADERREKWGCYCRCVPKKRNASIFGAGGIFCGR